MLVEHVQHNLADERVRQSAHCCHGEKDDDSERVKGNEGAVRSAMHVKCAKLKQIRPILS
jgi:hypothetical protein